jgi:hypothetical protein
MDISPDHTRFVGGAKKRVSKRVGKSKSGCGCSGGAVTIKLTKSKLNPNIENMMSAGALTAGALTAGAATGGSHISDDMKRQMMEHLVGHGFFSDLWHGIKSVVKPVASVAKVVLPIVSPGYGSLASGVISALGGAKPHKKKQEKKKRNVTPKQQERTSLIKEIMALEKVTLPQASRYIKAMMETNKMTLSEVRDYVKENGLT